MPLGVKVTVERIFQCSRRVVGDYCDGPLVRYGLAYGVAVICRIGHDDVGGQVGDEAFGLGCVAFLSGGQGEADRTSKPAHGHVQFCAQASARAANGLIFSPLFAPAAC